MVITLKNGEKLDLGITPVLLEYIEEYEDGLEGIQKDMENSSTQMSAINHLLYSVIASNYDEPLTYRQALRLISINDMIPIAEFLLKEIKNVKPKVSAGTGKDKKNHKM